MYGDRALRTSGASPGSWTARDQFSTASYSNSDGTQAWAGSWVEAGDDGKANGGSVVISGGLLSLKSANRSLARPADLAGASSATLSFAYRREGFASSAESVVAEMSQDGGATWLEVWRIAGPGKDSALVNASVNVAAFASANARLRFRTSAGMAGKRLFLDNVQISFDVPAEPPPPLPYNVRDEFTQAAFSNNDGTHRWISDWFATDRRLGRPSWKRDHRRPTSATAACACGATGRRSCATRPCPPAPRPPG